MRYLVISDIHGNWDALEAVLAATSGQYDRIVCCGDLVGYGPDPDRVVNWARSHLHMAIRGNHDRACCGLDDLEWFNPVAQAASRWTMAHLTPDNLEWLRELPRGPVLLDGFILSHGSPLDEDEYVMSFSDAANVYDYLEARVTFFGHTHLQGGFAWERGHQRSIWHPRPGEPSLCVRLDPDGAYLINPGSVGQPRDGDSRAAWALFEDSTLDLLLGRIAYDHESVRRRIEAVGLPPSLGARLGLGR